MKTTFKTEFYRVHIEMIRCVVKFALNNSAITQSVPAFNSNIQRLQTNLDAVDTFRQTALNQISGYAARKKAFKTSLLQSSVTIMQAVYTFALETGNLVLAGQMTTTFTKLNRMPYPDLVNFVQNAINIISPIIPSLSDYNVTQANVNAWQANTTALANILSSANNAIAQRKSTNRQIQTRLQQCMVILTNYADTLVLQIKQTYPAYYSEYRANRKLKPTGHISTQLRIHVSDLSNQPVTTGEVFIIGTDRSAPLNANGYALINYIPHGTHAISLTTPSATYNYPPIRFKLGQSHTINVQINTTPENPKSNDGSVTNERAAKNVVSN